MQTAEQANSWTPASNADRQAVADQLERLLASPLFCQSKRYPRFLRFAVEEVLAGHGSAIKERTIGIEVLGWSPDYDANADPAVRILAGEIRKRIAQYYFQPGHETELRIELPLGSYAPIFHRLNPSPRQIVASESTVDRPSTAGRHLRRWAWPVACALCLLAGFSLSRLRPEAPSSALQQFWSPILTAPDPVLICVSEPVDPPWNRPTSQATEIRHYFDQASGRLSFPNAIAMARVATVLSTGKKSYRLATEHNVTLNDMRHASVVLIGAMNNAWTMRMSTDLRFFFARDSNKSSYYWVTDKQNPSDRSLAYDGGIPFRDIQHDYAIVAKFYDSTCACQVLIAGGIGGYGTIAASEFLSDESSFNQLLAHAPDNWKGKNVEVLLSTQVVNGEPAPPRLVNTYFW